MRRQEILAVIFSDLHLENYKKFNEGKRRLKNAKDVIRKIALVCKKYKAISIFTGDLYHKEKGLTNDILEDTLPFFSKLYSSGKFETFGITGNHDQSQQNLIGKESPSYIKTLAKTFKGFHCFDFSQFEIPDTNVIVHGVPYLTHDIGLIKYINDIKVSPAYKNILALHTTMPGAKDTDGREVHSNIENNEFNKAIQKFDLVICGHVHKPSMYKVGMTTVVQVGAPQQQRLTDKNCEMGYWLLYHDLKMEFVPFKGYPKFIEIENISQKTDNTNFYVLKPKRIERTSKEGLVKRDFGNTLDKEALAENYCKEKGISDKRKSKALSKTLKNVE